MRVPLSWLKEYVSLDDLSVEELAHRLTLAGLEIAAIEYLGLPADLTEARKWATPISTDHLVWDREKLVVGHVTEVKQHPDADRLLLAMVDSGTGEIEQAVTGAPNLFQYAGKGPFEKPMAVVYAREGAELLDPYSDEYPDARMILKPKKLRGIMNKTMVCSEKEIGLSEEHEGIMLLDTDAAPGTPIQDVLGDVILDIELTPNLARCFSIFGVAREVAALTGQSAKYPSLDITASGPSIEGQAALDIREPELNPRFTLALIKDIEIRPSPDWVQRRLRKVGMRPINNIVDATNYIMMETGQPLHAFDYDVLVQRAGGKAPTIITRLPDKGEKLTTLDDVERELDPFTILVADTAGALSLGGIMGGAESEVSSSTTKVLLESAAWNFINLRQTLSAQRERGKDIPSEAGARFSRGVHPAQAEVGLRRAIEMMREWGGGEIAQGIIDEYPTPPPTLTVDLPLSEIERLVGISVAQDEVMRILSGLEFTVEKLGDDAVRATVPEHRLDIGVVNNPEHEGLREVIAQADLVEEVARIYGYDRIPETMIADVIPPQHANPRLEQDEEVRDLMVNSGLTELISYRLTTPEHEARLTPPGAESDWPGGSYVTMKNPISVDRTSMRHTVLNSMLDVMAANARWRSRQTLFEVGTVYLPQAGEKLPREERHLCIGLMGARDLPVWGGDAGEPMDFYDLKGIVDALVAGLHLHDVAIEAAEHSSFFPGRAARLIVGKDAVGVFGEVHPKVVEAYELPDQPVLAAEFNLELLQTHWGEDWEIDEISNYPAVYQDIALIVDEGVPASEVEAAILEAGRPLLRDVRLFDVYRGEQIGEGKKSLAYALAFQALDKTLKDKDADKAREKIVQIVGRKLGATLRG